MKGAIIMGKVAVVTKSGNPKNLDVKQIHGSTKNSSQDPDGVSDKKELKAYGMLKGMFTLDEFLDMKHKENQPSSS